MEEQKIIFAMKLTDINEYYFKSSIIYFLGLPPNTKFVASKDKYIFKYTILELNNKINKIIYGNF